MDHTKTVKKPLDKKRNLTEAEIAEIVNVKDEKLKKRIARVFKLLYELVDEHGVPVLCAIATEAEDDESIDLSVAACLDETWTPSEFAVASQIITKGIPEYPSDLIEMIAKISIERDIRMGKPLTEQDAEFLGIDTEEELIN